MKKVIALMFLLSFIVLPTYVCAKVRMGSRTMSVGDVEQLIVAYSHETATGSWKISEGNACRISARSTKSCQITAIRAGKCTVTWTGVIDAGFYDDYYWDITVEGGDSSGGDSGGGSQSSSDGEFYENTVEGIPMRFWLGGDNDIAIVSEKCISTANGKVTIPGYANGLPVRTIYNAAFLNISGLTELVIPSSVKWVQEGIVYLCDNLTTIVCYAETPPTASKDYSLVNGSELRITLYVPKGCKSKYANANGWKRFSKIKEIGVDENVIKTIDIDEANFPNEDFRTYLINRFGNILTEDEIQYTTYMSLPGGVWSLYLKGIEFFINLKGLNCSWNRISPSYGLDLSKNKALETLKLRRCVLYSLDVSENKSLNYIDCSINSIKDKEMDVLINSLPYNTGNRKYVFRVLDKESEYEGNVCTTTQVAVAKARGWIPYYYNGSEWLEYEGSAPTTIKSSILEESKKTPIYNLNGQRLDKPCKGVNIIGGKKIMVK